MTRSSQRSDANALGVHWDRISMTSQLRKLRAGQYVFRFRKTRYTTVIIHMLHFQLGCQKARQSDVLGYSLEGYTSGNSKLISIHHNPM